MWIPVSCSPSDTQTTRWEKWARPLNGFIVLERRLPRLTADYFPFSERQLPHRVPPTRPAGRQRRSPNSTQITGRLPRRPATAALSHLTEATPSVGSERRSRFLPDPFQFPGLFDQPRWFLSTSPPTVKHRTLTPYSLWITVFASTRFEEKKLSSVDERHFVLGFCSAAVRLKCFIFCSNLSFNLSLWMSGSGCEKVVFLYVLWQKQVPYFNKAGEILNFKHRVCFNFVFYILKLLAFCFPTLK